MSTLASGEGSFDLSFEDGSERYALIVQSLNAGSGTFPLTVSGSVAPEVRSLSASARAATPAGQEAQIRAAERRAITRLPGISRRRRPALSDDPPLGSTRTFNVVNRTTAPILTNRAHFDEVTATLRYKGERTLIYVDTRAEGPNVTNALLDQVGDRFDDHTYGIDRSAFGEETDIDANGRVIVLMTATVNALNTEQTVEDGGIFTGFFFGIDLLFHPTLNPFANNAEIFYTLVPDPDKLFGAAEVSVQDFAEQMDGVLAHEFEHMINAGIRLDADAPFETVWLDEGLAHFAETLNGVTFNGRVDFQNTLRSALWLQQPYGQSLVSGDDTLERRGAAWLLVAYLVDRHGTGILRQLVAGPSTGITNLEIETGTSFSVLFHRFTAALFLDGQGITTDPVFNFSNLDLRQQFQAAKTWWAGTDRLPGSYLGVKAGTLPGGLGSAGISLAGSSPAYFDVGASTPGNAPVVVQAAPQSNLQVTIIRTQ